jgi:uncharacterized membrane protein (UPF0127 family)
MRHDIMIARVVLRRIVPPRRGPGGPRGDDTTILYSRLTVRYTMAVVHSLMALVVLSGLALDSCKRDVRPTAPREAAVRLLRRDGSAARVVVELAKSEPERTRGLMHRTSLAAGHGMLFLFERPSRLKFWMKNTYIPLDMIFIDEQRRVVAVEENAEPLTLEPRGPDRDAQFVLEVPGGWARENGVEPGTAVEFVDVD